MKLPFTGGCACGAVRYECAEAPARVYHCHCIDCQKATGSAFHTGLLVKRAAFRFTKGEPKTWDRPTDSGNTVTEAFCETCGTPLYVCSTGRPEGMSIKAGSLDDPKAVTATTQIWTQSAVSWADISHAGELFEQGVPMGPMPKP